MVAHNYGLSKSNTRDCDQDPGHPARDGMNNLEADSVLDWDRRKCYDTAPFRDQSEYADSQYIQMFEARGGYFMGCKNAQADDPTVAGAPNAPRDRNTKKVLCE